MIHTCFLFVSLIESHATVLLYMLTDIHVCVAVVQEVATRSVTKTQVEVENGDEEEEVVQTVSVFHARLTIKQPTRLM